MRLHSAGATSGRRRNQRGTARTLIRRACAPRRPREAADETKDGPELHAAQQISRDPSEFPATSGWLRTCNLDVGHEAPTPLARIHRPGGASLSFARPAPRRPARGDDHHPRTPARPGRDVLTRAGLPAKDLYAIREARPVEVIHCLVLADGHGFDDNRPSFSPEPTCASVPRLSSWRSLPSRCSPRRCPTGCARATRRPSPCSRSLPSSPPRVHSASAWRGWTTRSWTSDRRTANGTGRRWRRPRRTSRRSWRPPASRRSVRTSRS